MRLERIGDLLMVLEAIRDARAAWPEAEIDLAVGSWNEPLAALIPDISNVVIADAPWLARNEPGDSWTTLFARVRGWRERAYDLVLNFEPDIRSNILAWLSRAPARVGYSSGGGGALLTDAPIYEPTAHVSTNARRLVARAAGRGELMGAPAEPGRSHLAVPDAARRRAHELLGNGRRPLVGRSRQRRPRVQAVASRSLCRRCARDLARERNATIVLTGAAADRPLVDAVRAGLQDIPLIDVCGALRLVELAAILAELDVLVTGDTGPMHLAAAVGTPVVALFGPSNPDRYGPMASARRILRVDLWCSPCGQVRLPPPRCRGHVPECLDRHRRGRRHRGDARVARPVPRDPQVALA